MYKTVKSLGEKYKHFPFSSSGPITRNHSTNSPFKTVCMELRWPKFFHCSAQH